MARKVADCRDYPSESNCSLTIAGEEDEVLRAAAEHAVAVHRHDDTPELREQIRGMLKDEGSTRGEAGYGSIMRGRIKRGQQGAYEQLMRDLAPRHLERGLVSADLAWEEGDPERVVVVIRFRDRDSYLRNAENPDTHRDYERQVALLDGEPEWLDVSYAESVTAGAAPATV